MIYTIEVCAEDNSTISREIFDSESETFNGVAYLMEAMAELDEKNMICITQNFI